MGLFSRKSVEPPAVAEPKEAVEAWLVDLPEIGSISVSHLVDCSGENCPRPQLRTKRAITREMEAGQVMELMVDNPTSPELVPTIMDDIGATHLGTVRTEGMWHLYIRKDR
ncbi:MAG: sulfurtransferase TusA family protein [Chloroflexota bacterium]